MRGKEIAEALSSRRYRAPMDELRLQEEIAQVLDAHGHGYAREVALGPGERIDFLIEGALGLEIKVQGSAMEVTRQLLRYAAHERITGLVLFTTRTQIVVPPELSGKPVWTARYFGGL